MYLIPLNGPPSPCSARLRYEARSIARPILVPYSFWFRHLRAYPIKINPVTTNIIEKDLEKAMVGYPERKVNLKLPTCSYCSVLLERSSRSGLQDHCGKRMPRPGGRGTCSCFRCLGLSSCGNCSTLRTKTSLCSFIQKGRFLAGLFLGHGEHGLAGRYMGSEHRKRVHLTWSRSCCLLGARGPDPPQTPN